MTFKKVAYYFVIFISSLIVVASLLSLIYDLPYWYSKLLDFPRLQYLIAGGLFLILFILLTKKWNKAAISLAVGLVVSIFIQSSRIFPYWFGDKAVPDMAENYSEEDAFGLLLANVLITNKKYDKLLEVIKNTDPDMILAMEVDQKWLDKLEVLKEDYPYVVEQPNDVAYGMALYSRLPLEDTEIKYIKHENVPSFHSKVSLRSGKEFMLHAVHPVAPMPSDKYPDNVGEAEIELIRVGEMVAAEELPSMVAGDFNDVSWSNTSRLFGKDGDLRNVRLGRGLYNSFDANSMLMRWPLDHYFATKEFRVVELKRLKKIGSDHFPVYARFVLSN
jgi:endonuclease/exonuclease/phosphatase (EEP) superfamily protein YafD